MVSKFKPNKDLRVYLYCKNENGRIRETFTDSEGHFLNPFNGYTVDKGDSGSTTIASPTSVTPSSRSIQNSIIHNISSGASIPSYIRRGNIALRNPEALGELIIITRDKGKFYSYYRANSYKVAVKYAPTGQVVYTSTFKVRYNNLFAEAKRKILQMSDAIDPTLSVSLDRDRVGAVGVHPVIPSTSRSYNKGFYNEVRVIRSSGLDDMGIFTGVKTKILATFELKKRDNSTQSVQKELSYDKFYLPGIVEGYSAKIQYISEESGELILEKPMRLITGEPFSVINEALDVQRDRRNRQRLADNARQTTPRVDVSGQATGGHGVGGGYGGGYGGGSGSPKVTVNVGGRI